MATLRIHGGLRLQGTLVVEGNKNAALPLMAACLLTGETCTLTNMPRIRDVEVLAKLLVGLGAKVEGIGSSTLRITCASFERDDPDPALVGRLRGSVLLLGSLLARRGRARLAQPGGDFPTRRTISTHLQALIALGARVLDEPGHALECPDGLTGASFYLDEASVTGTETAVLAAVGARGITEIRHAATEPHVAELCRFLRAMGAEIEGEGTSTIRIDGQRPLHGAEYRLQGDFIEAGSWAVVTAITGGDVEVMGARGDDMEVVAAPLRKMGLRCITEDDRFVVEHAPLTATRRITTGLWPGFPSDMVSLVTVLATQAEGQTLVHDWMYELRLFALEQLSSMKADLFLCDPHRILVGGPTKLKGRLLDSRDIRSGMALIAAALAADGQSTLAMVETVERGYGSLVERLRALGGDVERVED